MGKKSLVFIFVVFSILAAYIVSKSLSMALGISIGTILTLIFLFNPVLFVAFFSFLSPYLFVFPKDIVFFANSPMRMNVVGLLNVYVWLVSFLYILMLFTRQKRGGHFIFKNLPYFVLMVLSFVSLLYTPVMSYGLRFFYKFVGPYLLFLLTLNAVRGEKDIKLLLKIIIFSGIGLVIIAYAEAFAHIKDLVFARYRVKALSQAPASYAHFAVLIFSIIFSSFLIKKKKIYAVASVIIAVSVLFTFTRIDIICLFFIFVVSSIIMKRNVVPVIILGVILLVLSLEYIPGLYERLGLPDVMRLGLSKAFEESETFGTLRGRIWMWKSFIKVASESPLFGRGMGYADYYGTKFLTVAKTYAAHNEYIRIFVDMGYVGVFFLIWLFGYNIYRAKTLFNKSTTEFSKSLSLGLLNFSISIPLISVTDNILPFTSAIITYFVLFAVVEKLIIIEGEQIKHIRSAT